MFSILFDIPLHPLPLTWGGFRNSLLMERQCKDNYSNVLLSEKLGTLPKLQLTHKQKTRDLTKISNSVQTNANPSLKLD